MTSSKITLQATVKKAEQNAIDASDCAIGMLKSLAATFAGIQALAGADSKVTQLAMVGAELAEDYMGTIESFQTRRCKPTEVGAALASSDLRTAASNMRAVLEAARQSGISQEEHSEIGSLLEAIREALPNYSQDIVLTGSRAKRFSWTIGDLADLTVSLETTAKVFPEHVALTPGQIAPALAVEAFAAGITKRLELLYSILANEDEPEAGND